MDNQRRAELAAIHYLGSDDAYLEMFMEWWRTRISKEQREKWRAVQTLVKHFRNWQEGIEPNKDRRTPEQKAIERVRTDGHKADAAQRAEIEQVRRELATRAIETTDTLYAVLRRAGPNMAVQALMDHDDKDYARAMYNGLRLWLGEAM